MYEAASVPEEHRKHGELVACEIDVVQKQTACCFSLIPHVVLDFSSKVNYRSACKCSVWVECRRRRDVLIELKRTQTHTERETTGECANQALRITKLLLSFSCQSLFVLLFYLSSSHVSFFLSFDKSFFPKMFAHHFPPSCLIPLALPCLSHTFFLSAPSLSFSLSFLCLLPAL